MRRLLLPAACSLRVIIECKIDRIRFFRNADRARLTVTSSQDWITSQNSSTQLVASNEHLVDRVLASSAEYYSFTEVKAIDALASDETSRFAPLSILPILGCLPIGYPPKD
jgi:hypothetical protein